MRIRLSFLTASLLLSLVIGTVSVSAVSPVPLPNLEEEVDDRLRGVFITEVPQWECAIFCGSRRILEGDVLTASQFSSLTAEPYADNETTALLSWLPIYEAGFGEQQTFLISLRGNKNKPPEAEDSRLETYKNLSVSGSLKCEDPEGDALTYTVVIAPKRGDVAIESDGTFTYTPRKNKVGTDRFVYTATDGSGNTSAEATVTVQIQNPRIKGTFADMNGDPNEYEARYLRENGICSGEWIGDTLCFCPERGVSGNEFLVMLMHTAGIEAEEVSNNDWLTPWKEAALRAGLRTPVSSECITEYEAASLVSSLLDLEEKISVSVFADDSVTAGSVSMCALKEAGLPRFGFGDMRTLTRREAAVLLCGTAEYLEAKSAQFPWE
ncbi:MAG: cadherin-like domain-containing protein [Oscillospiraceae bacterium]|nr:cadherin-like domain-containing protein [Oscillospiraceae bacterium]